MSRVTNFLNMYNSDSTIRAYRWSIRYFFNTIYNIDIEDLDKCAEQYFSEQRNYEADLHDFLKSIGDKPPKSVRLLVASVKTLLVENDVELPQKFWRRLRGRIKGSRALTLDKVPSNKELKNILTHMPIQGKALFLLLSSSGMRIGEAFQLQLEDLDLEQNMINIRGEYSKTGNPRRAFFSSETKEYLEEWLRNREDYLKQAVGRSGLHDKEAEDTHVFPFSVTNAYTIWKIGLKKSNKGQTDPSTGRLRIHPHVLRKFYRTKLGSVIPIDVVEALMGHEGYLTEVYRRYSVEDLAKFYKEGEYTLQIFGANVEQITTLKDELKKDREDLQRIVNGLTAENLELKSRQARIELEHTEFKRDIRKELEELKEMVKEMMSPVKPEEIESQ